MELPSIFTSTKHYEAWLGTLVPLLKPQLRLKHAHMREAPFSFLRATFYRWMELWQVACPELHDATRVLAVGDLHIENFGTWRDLEGRLIWGINDFDEAFPLPYALDLVRLAVSARLAIRSGTFHLDPHDAMDSLLEGYGHGLAVNGHSFVLEEHNRWLRKIATGELRDPALFWDRFTRLTPAQGIYVPAAKRVLQKAFVAPVRSVRQVRPITNIQYLNRIAGLGSLGRPRVVALGEWGNGNICREAKRVAPSACYWAARRKSGPLFIMKAVQRARRVQDPFYSVRENWVVRRLAPHCSKIDMAHLPHKRDELALIHAMGMETANIHLGSLAGREILKDISRARRKAIIKAVDRMTELVLEDWRSWRES